MIVLGKKLFALKAFDNPWIDESTQYREFILYNFANSFTSLYLQSFEKREKKKVLITQSINNGPNLEDKCF